MNKFTKQIMATLQREIERTKDSHLWRVTNTSSFAKHRKTRML